MSGAVLILATAPTRDEAARIAEALVSERLAACVQISAVESWYVWEGRVEQAAEHRLHVKTTADRADAVTARIEALHSYDVPEVVVLPIAAGSARYLSWVAETTSSPLPGKA